MLQIDNREIKLIELLKTYSTQNKTLIPIDVKPLHIGDIIIEHTITINPNPVKYTIIIERKCVNDMIASIKDGRYKEQKIRLKAEIANTSSPENQICFIYLIEGSQSDLRLPQDKTMLNGAIISSQFRDKIPIIRTYTMLESVEMILRLRDRLIKDPHDIFPSVANIQADNPIAIRDPEIASGNASGNASSNDNAYINSLQNIKKQKKDNITPQNWNIMCYMNIPGISSSIALKIAEKYPSILDLIKAYETVAAENPDSIESGELLLADIVLIETEKQKRRLGNVISKRVYDYIFRK
jgi:crossover junction endonuclease MUS81